jgi:hypothetical protein
VIERAAYVYVQAAVRVRHMCSAWCVHGGIGPETYSVPVCVCGRARGHAVGALGGAVPAALRRCARGFNLNSRRRPVCRLHACAEAPGACAHSSGYASHRASSTVPSHRSRQPARDMSAQVRDGRGFAWPRALARCAHDHVRGVEQLPCAAGATALRCICAACTCI